MNSGLSASMMCANFIDLKGDLEALQAAAIEYLHFDIMDGDFVPNYTLGPRFLEVLRAYTDIPYDIHLMVEHPDDKLKYFQIKDGDCVSIHYESTYHPNRTLTSIKAMGAFAGIALNPATPFEVLENILENVDFVLLMMVDPGFSGQKLIMKGIDKIKKAREFLDKNNYGHIKIQVDGNVGFENAQLMHKNGADIFVLGTSGLFRKDMSIQFAADTMRNLLQ